MISLSKIIDCIDDYDYFPKELLKMKYVGEILSLLRKYAPTYYNADKLPEIFNSVLLKLYQCNDEITMDTLKYFILDYLRENKVKPLYYLDEVIDYNYDIYLSDIIPDNNDFTDSSLNKVLIYNIKKILSEKEWLVISLRYGLNENSGLTYSQRDISLILNIPINQVSRIESKCIKKLRKQLVCT